LRDIQGVSKIFGQNSAVSFPKHNVEKFNNDVRPQTFRFRGMFQNNFDPTAKDFCPWGPLKALMYVPLIQNETDTASPIWTFVTPFATALGPLKGSDSP
jgi:hypothetical protein